MRSPLDGCSDGYCKILGPAKGMHTNGGCRCLRYPEDQERFQKALAALKAERDTYRKALEKCADIGERGVVETAVDALSQFPNQVKGEGK